MKALRNLKVLLIGNYEFSQQKSMQRFASILRRGLEDAGCEVRLIMPKPFLGRLKPCAEGLGKWLGYADRFVFFRSQFRKNVLWSDIVHICDHSNAVYIPWLKGKPHVVTCHDLIAIRSALGDIPEYSTRWSGRVYQRWILRSLIRAHRLVCDSNKTRDDVLRLVNTNNELVSVVPVAVDSSYRPIKTDDRINNLLIDKLVVSSPYFLHVGGSAWYKNRIGVLRIYNQLIKYPQYKKHDLVMVGKTITNDLQRYIEEEGLSEQVKFIAGVSDEDLRKLYTSAEALIFPSLYEGFGWPIIEAQACGCLVVTSNRPPMTEVGGNAAIYIDPTDEVAASKMISNELEKSEELRTSGFVNAEKHTIDAMIKGYLDVYKHVISKPNRLVTA